APEASAASFHVHAVIVADDLAANGYLELLAVLLDVAVLRENHLGLPLARRGRAIDHEVERHREVRLRRNPLDLRGEVSGNFDDTPLLVSLLVGLDQFALALGLVRVNALAPKRGHLLAGDVPAVADLDGLVRHQLLHGDGGAAFAVERGYELLFVLVTEFLLALGPGDVFALLVQFKNDGFALVGVSLGVAVLGGSGLLVLTGELRRPALAAVSQGFLDVDLFRFDHHLVVLYDLAVAIRDLDGGGLFGRLGVVDGLALGW